MLTRSLLRTKIAQVLYAQANAESSLQRFDDELRLSLKKSYDLYHLLLLLPEELTFMAQREIEVVSSRLLKDKTLIETIEKFASQEFSAKLSENEALRLYARDNSLSWFAHYEDELTSLYKKLKSTTFFQQYTGSETSGFETDRALWKKFFRSKQIFDDEFDEFLEEHSIYWIDDLDVTLSFVSKTISRLPEDQVASYSLLPMFKDEDEENFVKKLAHSVFLNSDKYDQLISEFVPKWDVERITRMDRVLLQMAIAEFYEFPLIPVSVTINEYVEISKFYSTEKSQVFINGILDSIAKSLLDKGLLKAGER